MARLQLGDNPDPEPGGWPRLDAVMRNGWGVGVAAETVKLGEDKLAGYKVAHLTGTTRFKLDAEQLQELKDFIDKGGTLVVDAAGGAAPFADSAEKELPQLAALLGGTARRRGRGRAGGRGAGHRRRRPALHPAPTRRSRSSATAASARRASTASSTRRASAGVGTTGASASFYSREDLSAGTGRRDGGRHPGLRPGDRHRDHAQHPAGGRPRRRPGGAGGKARDPRSEAGETGGGCRAAEAVSRPGGLGDAGGDGSAR